ncbi:MAG: cupredoxin domain-containing protein, partial [Gaiellales bacterium]
FIRPTFVMVAPGASVTVIFRNAGLIPHRLYIEGAGVDALLQPGEEGAATVRAPQEGGVEFFDAIYRGQGARGAIVVRRT